MAFLAQAVMVRADIDVDRMNAQENVERADEIYVQQPNLLAPSSCYLATVSTSAA